MRTEDAHGHGAGGGDPWEWEGIFPTGSANSLTFRLQKVGEEGAKAYLLAACICFMYVREKSGKPIFTNLDAKPGV